MEKIVLYQIFTRLYGNTNTTRKHGGTIEENGCGKFNDFTPAALRKISELGVSHVWYTGVIRHATMTDYSAYGIPRQHPAVVKGRAGSPYAIADYYDVDPDLACNVDKRMEEFEQLVERTHKAGMKVLMWFEPERVTMVDALVKNYGYKAEWAISNDHGVITNDIGNPECLQWTLHRITKVMDENAVDLFREDNNSDPGTTWPMQDKRQAELTNLPRTGITENKAIQGHYALWDSIIAYCAANNKCTYIDNCASGGGRNDIESLRRSLPFMRSDADRTTTGLRLAMSFTFNKWIPFHGSCTREAVNELDPMTRGGNSVYCTRVSWLPIYNLALSFTHDETLDYDRVRSTIGEWRRYNHLLTKDFYVLTPYHSKDDTSGWTIFAYHDRDTDESVVQAFRQENCAESSYTVRLPYAKSGTTYILYNEDTKEPRTVSGEALLSEGITFSLDAPKSSAILHITINS